MTDPTIPALVNELMEEVSWRTDAEATALQMRAIFTRLVTARVTAEQERDQFKETAMVLEAHSRLLLSDTCTSEDRTRIRRAMGLIPEGEADRPDKYSWRPIDTSPKNADELVLLFPSRCWAEDVNADCEVGYWDADFKEWVTNSSAKAEDYTGPTHWMPLPDAPAPHGVIVRRETPMNLIVGEIIAWDGRQVRVSGMPDGVTLCRDHRGRIAVRNVKTGRLSYIPERTLRAWRFKPGTGVRWEKP